jgi:hypothetical protein
MCGLVGVFGDLYVDHLKFFKQALIADYFRGKHSTGMTCVKASGEVFNKKLALDPINFLDLKEVDSNILNTNTLMMGHNRHATLGGVTAANAHPFEHGNITLMHNGTLTNKHALQTNYKAPIFDTDSELVCWLLNEHSPEVIIPELQGAFALTWYDASDMTFNFIRNNERPMAMALDIDVLMYASEGGMLEWLMQRNSMKMKDFKFFIPDKGEHFKFSYATKMVSHEVKEIGLYVAPKRYPAYNGGNYDYHRSGAGNTGGNRALGNSSDDRFRQYQQDFGGNVMRNDIVFAYVDKVVERGYQSDTHFDLEMTLVNGQYTTVKTFYTAYALHPNIKEAFVVRGKVNACYMAGADPYFILDPDFDIINEQTDPYYAEYARLAIVEVEEIDESDEITAADTGRNIVMLGTDNALITADEYRKATKKGCFVCKEPIDAEKDINGCQETLVISKETAICVHCIDVYEQHLVTGVSHNEH